MAVVVEGLTPAWVQISRSLEQRVGCIILQPVSVQLLLLHAAVLKPDLDLAVGEVEHPRQLQPLLLVNVHAEKEFSLKFSDLIFGIRASLLAGSLSI